MADILPLGVEMIKHHSRITLVACGEHNYFAYLREFLQELLSVRPYVDSRVNLLAGGELYIELHIVGQVQSLIAMDQSLVQVQYHSVIN